MRLNQTGQVIVGAVMLLIVMTLLIPVMVLMTQRQGNWSVKEKQNTNAFHLAEASIDRAYQYITASTATWASIQNGNSQTGFAFDKAYSDLSGGRYAISITSGTGTQTVTIIGVGQDSSKKEVRALVAVYANSTLSNVGLTSHQGVIMSGNNVQVEWGSVMSQNSITIGSKVHPSYWSAGGIDLDTNGPILPNCDQPSCWWWHSYDNLVPDTPAIDFNFYQTSATNSGNDSCGNAYYQAGNYSNNCTDTTGHTYYIGGSWTGFKSAIVGNVVILGDMTFTNGKQATVGSYAATIPPAAWKQYCNDWPTYKGYDTTASVASASACFNNINNSYQASGVTYNINPAIHGFVYVGGNLTIPNGGGNSDLVHGTIVVQGTANINTNSNVHIYYDPNVAQQIHTTNVNLSRTKWYEIVQSWSCPPLAAGLCP